MESQITKHFKPLHAKIFGKLLEMFKKLELNSKMQLGKITALSVNFGLDIIHIIFRDTVFRKKVKQNKIFEDFFYLKNFSSFLKSLKTYLIM